MLMCSESPITTQWLFDVESRLLCFPAVYGRSIINRVSSVVQYWCGRKVTDDVKRLIGYVSLPVTVSCRVLLCKNIDHTSGDWLFEVHSCWHTV